MNTTTETTPALTNATISKKSSGHLPFIQQVILLTQRALIVNLRIPGIFAFIPSLLISVFTLIIYQAQLGNAAQFFLKGQSYLGFILPLSLTSATLSGSSVASQTIINDITRGYFNKLLLTPANRWALLLGPMIANAILLVVQVVVVLVIGLLLGLKSATGIAGLFAVLGFTILLGVSFSGLTVGVALLSGNSAATSSASFLFFPLTFLTATFVPVDLLQGWFKVAAYMNPITYFLEATRAILNTGWDGTLILQGLLAVAIMFTVLFAFALYSLRFRTKRR